MMRFNNPILICIFKIMREVGGKPLSESDWKAVLATQLPDSTFQAKRPDVTGWYTAAYVWSITAMASFMEALKSSRAAQKVFSTYKLLTCL